MKQYLAAATEAARQAGILLGRRTDEHRVALAHARRDVKLQADVDAERVIIEVLSAQSPFGILSEEAGLIDGRPDRECRWIVDPLDGTFNYHRGLALSCVSIGLWKDAEPMLGVILDFDRGQLFTGVVGQGAFCNDEPIHVSTVERPSDAVLCTGFPTHGDFSDAALAETIQQVQGFRKTRLLGSAALSLALLAKGSVDAYLEKGIKIWDVAAGMAIVRAAGGTVRFTTDEVSHTLAVYAHNGRLERQ